MVLIFPDAQTREFTRKRKSGQGGAVSLEMKPKCEKCEQAIALDAEAWICSYECTFCNECAEGMNLTCPNCGGELAPRPRRRLSS
jgi:hypothetical protein